jgi:hypothetical protein
MARATYIVPYVKWELLQRWHERHPLRGTPAPEIVEMQGLTLTENVEANSAAQAIEIVLRKFPGYTVIKSAITRVPHVTAVKKTKPTGKAKTRTKPKKLGGKARAKARGLFKERSARRR